MTKPRKILIFIINYHNSAETAQCIKQGGWDNNRYDVMIFDNESSGPDDIIQSFISQGCLYQHAADNIGFTGASNYGLTYAHDNGYDYILLLNNDAIFPAHDLDVLVSTVQKDKNIALASPSLYDPTDGQTFYGSQFKAPHITGYSEQEIRAIPAGGQQTIVYGTALLCQVSIIHKLGGLHTPYFAYYEDYDLARTVIRSGYASCVVPDSKATHKNNREDEVNTPRAAYYHYYKTRNGIRFWLRQGLSGIKPAYWHLRKALSFKDHFKKSGQTSLQTAIAAGVWDGLIGRMGRWRHHPTYRPDQNTLTKESRKP